MRGSGSGWSSRPLAATGVRALVLLVPLACAVGAAVAFARLVERPAGSVQVVWWAALFAVSSAVLAGIERASRRLLPLETLLRLSLVFPDRAPSRFRVALRAGSTRALDAAGATGAAELTALVAALSRHDRRTRGHSERVRAFSDLIAEELGLPPGDRDRLRFAALLHDLGKITVPAELLNRDGPLDEDEWTLVRSHPVEGARLAAPIAAWLGEWLLAIELHHERWDGTGYPRGLAGEQIPLGARIVAVADAFDVMTALRSYRAPLDVRQAREELVRCSGTDFDPAVVRALLQVSFSRLRRTVGPLAWLLQLPLALRAASAGGGHDVEFGGGHVHGHAQWSGGMLHPSAHLAAGAGLHPGASLHAGIVHVAHGSHEVALAGLPDDRHQG
jgi:HD-GYP domain-containing protein (c-di-GMP phosphodiesterase class II)